MPTKSKLKLPPLNLGNESLGRRLARFRKLRALTQVQLAHKMGLTQNLISAYECNRLGMQAEMVVRFALALGVSTDELLGLKPLSLLGYKYSKSSKSSKPSLKIIRRLNLIESLPPSLQKTLLKTIDVFIKAARN